MYNYSRLDTHNPSSPRRFFATLFVIACFALPAHGADWNQWRGPERDGSLPAGEPWPQDLSCLESQWRVELGPGYPGVIVAEDRIFVAETHAEEDEIVRALDRRTGQEIWRASWQGSWEVPFFARANGDWIRSTPAYDGESLFVGGIREVLVSFDAATGKERWRADFPARYGSEVPHFGFSSSPLLADGDLYVQAANSLVKVDKETGATIWRSVVGQGDIMVSGAFSSPIMATLGGKRQVVTQSRLALHGVDPDTGEELWSQEVPHFRGMNILTPTVWGDDMVLTSSYREGTFLYRIQQQDGAWSSELVWRHKSHAYMSSPVVVGNHAFLHLGNQRLTCLDLESGEDRWTSKPFGKYWSTVLNGDTLLALDERGELILVHARPEALDILDRKKISEDPTWGHLAVSKDQLFVRELEAVAAYRWCDDATKNSAPETTPSTPAGEPDASSTAPSDNAAVHTPPAAL